MLKNLKKLNDIARRHAKSSIYENSIYLILTTIMMAGTGFLFWFVAARSYTVSQVGIASAVVSSNSLIMLFSSLGLDISIIKYINEDIDFSDLINTCLTVALMTALLICIIFILGIGIWAPNLSVIKDNYIFLFSFIIFTSAGSIAGLQTHGVFIGKRCSKYSFLQRLVMPSRLLFIILFLPFGAMGIFVAYGIAPFLSLIIGFILTMRIIPGYRPKFKIDFDILKDIFSYSFANYLAKIFEQLPRSLLPLLVIAQLGTEQNAYFYIAWQITWLLMSIPRFTSMSLLAEGSHERDELKNNLIKSLKFIAAALSPGIIILLIYGDVILRMFGDNYAQNSYITLTVLVIGSIPYAINSVSASVHRVKENTITIILIYFGIAVTTIVGSYILMNTAGLVGVGLAWLIGNSSISTIIGLKIFVGRL